LQLIRVSDKLSAISLARLLNWLGENSRRLIGISIAVDAAADVPLLKSIVRHGKHNMRRPRRISAPQDATVQSSSNPVIGARGVSSIGRSQPEGTQQQRINEDLVLFARCKDLAAL
jgi:hypothetical protein